MSNPTTPFNWQMPTNTDLVTDLPADFEVFGQAVATSMQDLLGGTTGQVLAKASNADMDFVWSADAAGMTNPMTTTGDIIYSSPGSTPVRLGIGAANQILRVNSGATAPEWATPASTAINPNLVINGNFTINQRAYVSAANLASGSYGFDRWKSNYTNTTLTFTSAPAGQSVTINASGGLQQIVEQANVPAGSYTLSFAGTATGRIYNEGATPPSYAASPISFTADGLANVVVEFTAVSTTKTLSKVKLELGTSATAFVYSGNTIEGELANCQRYYYRALNTGNPGSFGVGMAYAGTNAIINIPFPVTMRVRPTALEVTGTATDYGMYLPGSSAANCDAVPFWFNSTTFSASIISTVSSGLTAGNATMSLGKTSNAYLGWSAEL